MKQLNEGLDFHDLKGMVNPKITVDEYAAKMGEDSDIVTLTFQVNSKLAGEDLCSWLELGYDFVLDASTSDGEIEPGKYLVFVEMKRRGNIPNKIITILDDLQTLTDMDVKEYTIEIDNETYDAEADILKQVMILNPADYKREKGLEDELNEMRQIAGLSNKNIYDNIDEEIKKYISNAGL